MSKTIWSSSQEVDYWYSKSLDELRQEYEDATEKDKINGLPVNEADESDFLSYFLPDNDDLAREDFENCILPELEKQCYKGIVVFYGKSANWQGYRDSALATDDVMKVFYPDYEATTSVLVENSNLMFSESSHDVPTGYALSLYSFKTKEDYERAEEVLKQRDEDFEICYFLDNYDYKDIEMLVNSGVLTPIKNTVNNYTGNEGE